MVASPSDVRHCRAVGFWRRAAAGFADAVVLVPLMALFAAVTAAVGGHPLRGLGELGLTYAIDLAVDGGPAGIAALIMASVVAFLYFTMFIALRGQTPGQRLVGAATIDAWGERPSPGRAVARAAAWFLSIAGASLGIAWIAFDREKRALHDWLAGTYVVHAADLVDEPAVATVREAQ